jgi:hypothetical protein
MGAESAGVSVYVDNMRARYGRMVMCHMLADSPEELHVMADAIGVARRWFQSDHYDICLSKRALAVAHGAIEVSARGIIAVRRRWNQSSKSTTDAISGR